MPVFIYQTEIPNAIPHIRDTYIACKKSSDIDIKKYYHCNDLQLLSVTELTPEKEDKWLLHTRPNDFTWYHVNKIEESLQQVGYKLSKNKSTSTGNFIFDDREHKVIFNNQKLGLEVVLKSYGWYGFKVEMKILSTHRHYDILETHKAPLTKELGICLTTGNDIDKKLLPDINSVIIKILDTTKKFM